MEDVALYVSYSVGLNDGLEDVVFDDWLTWMEIWKRILSTTD